MKQLVAVLIILGIGSGLIIILNLTKPESEPVTPERPVARVETISVVDEPTQLRIYSQGTVLPEIEIEIPVEVSGRIIEMSDVFKVGNRVKQGDILFRVDPSDYEVTHTSRRAERARAALSLEQEKALGEQAVLDWEAFGNNIEEASELTLRKPQIIQAEAALASAEALLRQAQRDLDRTSVRAPFDGYVQSKSVDFGQFVVGAPTSSAGQLFSSERAEVRLPVSEKEAQLIGSPSDGKIAVRFFSSTGETLEEWEGVLVRFEPSIDPATRLIHAVAVIENAFDEPRALRRGQFVKAEIIGREIEGAIELPRYALRGSSSVYVMTKDATLRTRLVSVLQADDKRVIVNGGLEKGERIVTSPIAFFVENMPVQEIEAQ